jgi:flagellar biosynthetic protein FliP
MARSVRSAGRRLPALLAGLVLLGGWACAQAAGPAPPQALTYADLVGTPAQTAGSLRLFLMLTALSLLPLALICMTSFVRVVVVLSMLRHALGLQETPPNMVLIGLALFLTLFSMQPTLRLVNENAAQPFMENRLSLPAALEKGVEPMKAFMIRQTREEDLALMVEVAGLPAMPATAEEVSLLQLVPAFMLSELRAAFQIGFVLFLPFLLVDLVVSGVLMSLGMMMVPPATIAIPLKVLLFVLIDGWNLVIRSLLGTIH